MLHKCALALAVMLVAAPVLAFETQPPTASLKKHAKNKAGPQTTGTLRPPAKVPSTTGAKTAQPATKTAKHAKPAKAKSKVAKSKTPNSKLSASNHRNTNRAMTLSRPAENRTPADTTGSVPPTPGLY